MGMITLDFKGLAVLDGGKLQAAFQAELAAAVRDCMDRPGDKSPRKVNLSMQLLPVMDETGEAANVQIKFDVKAAIPKRKTRTYEMLTIRGGGLRFSEHSPTNPNQLAFDDVAEREAASDEAPPSDGKSQAAGE